MHSFNPFNLICQSSAKMLHFKGPFSKKLTHFWYDTVYILLVSRIDTVARDVLLVAFSHMYRSQSNCSSLNRINNVKPALLNINVLQKAKVRFLPIIEHLKTFNIVDTMMFHFIKGKRRWSMLEMFIWFMTSCLSRDTTASFVCGHKVRTHSGKNKVNGFENLSSTTCAVTKLNATVSTTKDIKT